MIPITLQGKGAWLWLIPRSENGNPAYIAWAAKMAGLTHVIIKVADGEFLENVDPAHGLDLVYPVVEALHRCGIQAFGYQYVYGKVPEGEAEVGLERIHSLGLDGWVIDAESEYKATGMAERARRYMHRLAQAHLQIPVALSSYRFPGLHRQLPWREFLEYCDLAMPQVYWMGMHNPAAQVRDCLDQYGTLYGQIGFTRPIVMTGAAFAEHGWQATPGEVVQFLETAKALAGTDHLLDAVNLWEWWDMRSRIPDLWPALSNFDWGVKPMNDLDIWQRAVTDALRIEGYEIPNPPADGGAEPQPYEVVVTGTKPINIRKTPGGLDIGDLQAGSRVFVYPPEQRMPMGGVWYTWGRIEHPIDGWIALENTRKV